MSIIDKYNKRVDSANSLACVGLDSELEKLPERFREMSLPQFEFNKWVIDQTHEHVASYKLNIAFYEARGAEGLTELKKTTDYLGENHPDIFMLVDAKRGDIGNTNKGYINELFDHFGFDAMTLHPYMGRESLSVILDRADKGCIILCRTSNQGAGELQDLLVDGKPLWQIVAERVRDDWNKNDNCMLVVGATYPEEMQKIRELTPEMTFLVPGIGSQGGDIEATLKAGLDKDGRGLMIHSARGVIFADDPGDAARSLKEEINKYRT